MKVLFNPSFLLIFPAVLLLSACSSPNRTDCQEPDWYELGRRDGAAGKPLDYARKRAICSHTTQEQIETQYANGRHAGLIEYCTPENGFETGRFGQPYYFICPSHLEGHFLDRYHVGQSVQRLETENFDLASRIHSLEDRLRKPDSEAGTSKTNSEIMRLREAQAKIEEQLSGLQRSL